MTINVRVVVFQMPEKSTDGVVRTDVPIEQIRADLVDALDLGSPSRWDLAVVPANVGLTLGEYIPTNDDTLLLVRTSDSKGPSVTLNRKS
jgi:hypothetical protein